MDKHCEECKELATIPYVDYEGNLYREIRRARGWMAAFFVSICLLVVTNASWYVYCSQIDANSCREGVIYENGTLDIDAFK